MYAIIRTGGKQYRVQPGELVYLERLDGAVGEQITLSDVLLVSDAEGTRVGTPSLEGASVVGTIASQERAAKIRVFKYKKRKHYRRTKGHRQSQTALKVEAINA